MRIPTVINNRVGLERCRERLRRGRGEQPGTRGTKGELGPETEREERSGAEQ